MDEKYFTTQQNEYDLTSVRSTANTPVADSLYRSVFDPRVRTYCQGLLAICERSYLQHAFMKFCMPHTCVFCEKTTVSYILTATLYAETKSYQDNQHIPLQ